MCSKKHIEELEQIKEIKEMADIIHEGDCPLVVLFYNDSLTLAENLYNKGYRKASDVAREIFAEIEKRIADLEYRANTPRKTVNVEELKEQVNWILHEVVPSTIAELKKKYEILNSWEELTHTCQVEIPHTIESIADLAFTESEGEGK